MRTAASEILIVAFLVLGAGSAQAHPSVGIVADKHGHIFYSDLQRVWRIDRNGRKSIAVRDVHTHELFLDAKGDLYGQDSEYLGADRYRHRIWRLSAEGRLTEVIPWRDGFWPDFGFAQGGDGTMFYPRCTSGEYCGVSKRTRDGRTSDAAPGARFTKRLNFLAVGPDGTLFVADGRVLRRVDRAGRTSTLSHEPGGAGGAIFGMHVDASGNVYAAVYSTRVVVRVAPNGSVTTVARSSAPWGPTGVTIAPNGDLWVLEFSDRNEARARKVR